MRSVFSGSYSALQNTGHDDHLETSDQFDPEVYRSTTRPSFDNGRPPQERKLSLINSIKRAFRNRNSNSGRPRLTASQSVFVLPNIHESVNLNITSDRNRSSFSSSGDNGGSGAAYNRLNPRDRTKRMPTSLSMEEAALLGCHPSDTMDELELKNIQLSFPSVRTLARGEGLAVEERVDTKYGSILVGIQGDRSKPAIMTYHDLGLNYISNFQAFFNFVDMRLLLQNFCVYHINAPGQEEGAPTLPDNFIYPTMDQLAEQLYEIALHFGLKRVVCFGVGAGANILCRFALAQPIMVDALCVLNCVSTQAGWIEWGYQKVNVRNLKNKGQMTQGVLDYLMWHHFGKVTDDRNHDLTHVFRQYFESNVNPTNLGLFIDSYVRRTDLGITRELDPIRKKDVRTIRPPVLNVTGALSPHEDDSVTFNGRLDPVNSTWMKIQDCGMVMEEQPAKLAEAFRLFLQGQGYAIKLFRKNSLPEVPCLSSQKITTYRKLSVDSGASGLSLGSSVASLNNPATAGPSSATAFSTPKLAPTSTPLINLNVETISEAQAEVSSGSGNSSGKNSPGSSDSGVQEGVPLVEKGMSNIHITENPITSATAVAAAAQANGNPIC